MFQRNRIHLAVMSALAGVVTPAVLTLAPQTALAQAAEGTLYGRTKPAAKVSIVNLETGARRSITADASGQYTFSKLTPGRYSVESEGRVQEAFVALGSGTRLNFDTVELERIEVAGRRIRSAIDVNSVESNSVFTSEQIAALPVSRNVNAVAFLAPGVVQGDDGLGDGRLPSFAGASVGENGYYINGFDVTNIRNFLSYANLPFDAISQQQVKSGGYGAEYGRSLGGVISLLTKRGTNEWKGGVSLYLSPEALRESGKNVENLDPTTAEPNSKKPAYTMFSQASRSNLFNGNVYLGGPVIKDRLFVFGMVEGRHDVNESFGAYRSTETVSNRKPNGMIKVDFMPSDNHHFEYTGISNKQEVDITDFHRADATVADKASNWYLTSHSGTAKSSQQTAGGSVHIGKYTGYLTDSLTVSAMAGRVEYQQPQMFGARLNGGDCPTVYEVGATVALGCWNGIFPGAPGRDPNAPPTDEDIRKAWRLDLEYTLGNHTLRAGVDNQTFLSSEAGGSSYSGGAYWRYYVVPSTGKINGVGGFTPGTPMVRKRTYLSSSGEYEVTNEAWYLEDSWKVTRNVLLYAGLRGESFDNKNADNISFVKADNLMAPRMGFSWNAAGDSSMKVFGNFGRYYIPVASNTNIRATRAEGSSESWYTYTGRDPVTGAPTGLSQRIGNMIGTENLQLPHPATVADTKLSPMSQDEWILGFQKSLAKNWTGGVKAVHRKVNDGMDDFCGAYAIKNYVVEKLNPAYDAGDVASCVLMNPGRDLNLKVDVMNDGKLVDVTIPASYLGLAKYKRTYNAVELTLDRAFDGQWAANFSYTWSKNKGTAEGYVQSNLDQEDAGITQDFDFGSFTHGADGFLPNDRRHVFKAYGTYALTDAFRIGANYVVSSGRPLSCIGYVPSTVSDFPKVDGHYGSGDYTSASSYYCLDSNTGMTKLVPRGSVGRTSWTQQLDLQFGFNTRAFGGKLSLQADVFNVFDSRKATELNEVRDYSRAGSNSQPGQLNPNYMQPTSFQGPRSVRLSARYEF